MGSQTPANRSCEPSGGFAILSLMKRVKVILDFDGTLTDEARQAKELSGIAKRILAEEILEVPLQEVEELYSSIRKAILTNPHRYHWSVNGLKATYAYEGAYLLNTSILQEIMRSNLSYIKTVMEKFPADTLDSVTLASNHLFHRGTMQVRPHFVRGVRRFLLELIENPVIDPVIITNSETRKIEKNLAELSIGRRGGRHLFRHEIEILGDTRQYHMDPEWNHHFVHHHYGSTQVLPVDTHFSIDLRRPVYHAVLMKILEEGHDEVVVVADGLSLAGALPLVMGLRFILKKADYTPHWCEACVTSYANGLVVQNLQELKNQLLSIVQNVEA